MHQYKELVIGAKCAPQEEILDNVQKAGLSIVELYLSEEILCNLTEIIKTCRKFNLRFTVHAPTDSFDLPKLARLVRAIEAEVVVLHNIYWEDEWPKILNQFKNTKTRLCVENTFSVHEPRKFMRRYGVGSCLDLEHLQMECGGVFEEEFIRVMRLADYIHLTGFVFGRRLWHTHIHRSPGHNMYMLGLLKKADYRGIVISEAQQSYQTYAEFKKLNRFFKEFQSH